MHRDRSAILLWGGVLFLATLMLYMRAVYNGFDQVLFADNDDAMRMVVVRDFLNGQNWFDHKQYRLDTPYGGEMHWSRLIDLPIAALVLLARPFFGAMADNAVGYAWPVMLLGVHIWLNGLLALRLVGREGLLPGMLFAAFSVVTFGEFDFGRIDHHSAQIILTQLTVLFSIDALARPNGAAWAGLAVATSLAIGTETLPVVVAAILVYGVMLVVNPAYRGAVRWFGLAFGLGCVGHLMIALPPSLWFTPYCDAISIVYAVAGLLAGLGLAGLTLVRIDGWALRLLAGAVAGGVVLAVVVVLFPGCLKGPYAIVDPWLVDNWLAGIGEAMPLPVVMLQQPVYVVAASVPAFLALIFASHAAWRSAGQERAGWLILVTVLAVIIAVAFIQVRSIRMAAALIAPGFAYCVLTARRRYLERGSIGRILALVAGWLGFAGIVWGIVVALVVSLMPSDVPEGGEVAGMDRSACLAPGAYDGLAMMPAQRAMTPLDLGAFVLLYTPHDVVSAPYHRNNQAILDTYQFFNGPIEDARDMLGARGITLVVTCEALPEMGGLPQATDDSFVRLYARNELPAWLTPLDNGDGPLVMFAVEPN